MDIETRELQELNRYRDFLELGWDERAAWHLVRSGSPLLAPKGAKAANAKQEVKATAPKVERPKPKPKRNDAAYNERRMRDAILRRAKENGWFGGGVRELAREAGMPHKTADDALDRMVADGQVERDRREGKHGNRHGFKIIREHPCWSEHKPAHSLQRSDTSLQVEG
jgi:hypothetical protein